jgi:hypothetical protein
MVSCARATRGLRRPSHGLMARLGVPVGGRVRKLRAMGHHLARPVWPVSLVPPVSHVPRQRNYARSEGQPRPLPYEREVQGQARTQAAQRGLGLRNF